MKRILTIYFCVLAIACTLDVTAYTVSKNDQGSVLVIADGDVLNVEHMAPAIAKASLNRAQGSILKDALIPETLPMGIEPLASFTGDKAPKQKQDFEVPFLGTNQMARPPNWRS